MYRFIVGVRNDYLLKRKIEQRAKRWQCSLLVPRRTPDQKLPASFRQGVSKDYDPLLRQPDGGLKPPSSIVKRDKTTRKHSVRFENLQRCLGHVVGPEEPRTERTDLVATDKLVNVPHMIRDDYSSNGRRPIVKTLPQLLRARFRDERVKHQPLAPRFDKGRRHDRLPVIPRLPVMMLRTPDPQPLRHITKLDPTGHRLHDMLYDHSSS